MKKLCLILAVLLCAGGLCACADAHSSPELAAEAYIKAKYIDHNADQLMEAQGYTSRIAEYFELSDEEKSLYEEKTVAVKEGLLDEFEDIAEYNEENSISYSLKQLEVQEICEKGDKNYEAYMEKYGFLDSGRALSELGDDFQGFALIDATVSVVKGEDSRDVNIGVLTACIGDKWYVVFAQDVK